MNELTSDQRHGKSRFPTIVSISVKETYILCAVFDGGVRKQYDMRRFADVEFFSFLFANPTFIKSCRVEAGGHGIVWNDEIDLASSEVWNNGEVVNTVS